MESDLIKFIVEAGFDSETSILLIDQNSIVEIESYINSNKDILKNSIYESFTDENKTFKFKPGHKAAILSVPNKIKKIKPHSVLEAGLEENSEDEDDILKQAIINKIAKFVSKLPLDVCLDETCVSDLHKEESGKIKCKFECPICARKLSCEYKKYWIVSNLERHLKNHLKDVEFIEFEEENQEKNRQHQNHAIDFIEQNALELSNVLSD